MKPSMDTSECRQRRGLRSTLPSPRSMTRLVYEDDGGCTLRSRLEQRAHQLLSFAHPLGCETEVAGGRMEEGANGGRDEWREGGRVK